MGLTNLLIDLKCVEYLKLSFIILEILGWINFIISIWTLLIDCIFLNNNIIRLYFLFSRRYCYTWKIVIELQYLEFHAVSNRPSRRYSGCATWILITDNLVLKSLGIFATLVSPCEEALRDNKKLLINKNINIKIFLIITCLRKVKI